jgi:hypothetical protein
MRPGAKAQRKPLGSTRYRAYVLIGSVLFLDTIPAFGQRGARKTEHPGALARRITMQYETSSKGARRSV